MICGFFQVLVASVLQQLHRAQVLVDLVPRQQHQLKTQDSEDLVQLQLLKVPDLVLRQQHQLKAQVLEDLVQQPRVRPQDLEDLVRQLLAHQLSVPLEDLVLQPVNLGDYSELKISPPDSEQLRVSQEACLGPLTHQQQALAVDLVELARVLVPLLEEHLAVELIQASTTSEQINSNNNNNNNSSRGLRPRALMPRCTSQ